MAWLQRFFFVAEAFFVPFLAVFLAAFLAAFPEEAFELPKMLLQPSAYLLLEPTRITDIWELLLRSGSNAGRGVVPRRHGDRPSGRVVPIARPAVKPAIQLKPAVKDDPGQG
jgi:hypothetical protein